MIFAGREGAFAGRDETDLVGFNLFALLPSLVDVPASQTLTVSDNRELIDTYKYRHITASSC